MVHGTKLKSNLNNLCFLNLPGAAARSSPLYRRAKQEHKTNYTLQSKTQLLTYKKFRMLTTSIDVSCK